MRNYIIFNTVSGHTLGYFDGDTELEALAAMARDCDGSESNLQEYITMYYEDVLAVIETAMVTVCELAEGPEGAGPDGYMLGASEHAYASDPDFWGQEHEDHAPGTLCRLWRAIVPVPLAHAFLMHGTEAQKYRDGYQAITALQKLAFRLDLVDEWYPAGESEESEDSEECGE